MTLDEAIKNAEEVAEQNETQAEKWQEEGGEKWGKTTVCRERAKEHRQLAEWLKDYQRLLSTPTISIDHIKQLREEVRNHKQRLEAGYDKFPSEREVIVAKIEVLEADIKRIDNMIKEYEVENSKSQDTDLDLDR